MSENQIVIFCTTPDRGSGETLAKGLVEERLAACVNVAPGLLSTYRWQGKVEQAEECLLIIKTLGGRFEDVKRYIEANHPYELPEIIALPIDSASPEYTKWLTENSK
jgi:periplasmic divalent cation tolerance protein